MTGKAIAEMKIRSLFLIIAVIVLSRPIYAQYSSIVFPFQPEGRSTNIFAPAGRIVEIVSFHAAGQGSSGLSVAGVPVTTGFKLAGPATLTMQVGVSSGGALTYRMFDNIPGVGEGIPSTAVVIPADSAGPVQIILESSTDMVTWTPASPGTYGASTSKRFFRVRAAQQ